MKKLIFLLSIIFAFNSCTSEGDSNDVVFILPIEQVVMPSEYLVGTISEIKIKYKRPTDCHIFNGFYTVYDAGNQNSRTISIQTIKLNNTICNPDGEDMLEVGLDFKPTSSGVYTFKFWLGLDANGNNEYETHQVEVL